jgi:ribulose-phosphate 3-epimerase
VNQASVRIGPSILTVDWLRLGDQIRSAVDAGVDFIHLDVMDGSFVPNISFGFAVIEAVRSITTLPLDVHLMIVEPERYIERFVEAGADVITVHVETCPHLHGVLRSISSAGAQPGVTLNPGTPVWMVEEVIPIVEQVLVMAVNPGFGGQSFIPIALDRISRIKDLIDGRNPKCRLEVDGGVKRSNIGRIVAAGADSVVVGSALFSADVEISRAVRDLREQIDGRETRE